MTYILAFSNTPCLRKRSWSGRNVNYGLTGYELSNELGYPTGYHTNDKNQNTGNRNLEKNIFPFRTSKARFLLKISILLPHIHC